MKTKDIKKANIHNEVLKINDAIVYERGKDIVVNIENVKNNISEYFIFRAKVRSGEVWNKEMGDLRVKELCEDVKQAAQYSEV